MKKILVFGAPVFQIPIVAKAKEMGLYVGIVDINPDSEAVSYADEYFCCSLRDNEKLLAIAQGFKPNGIVIGACDTSVVSASYVCQQLGLPGHSLATAFKATDKVAMLQAFQAHGVAHPRFQVVRKSQIDDFELKIPYPVISKPTDGSGSRGICFIRGKEELAEALQYSSQASRSGDLLVEEFMEGPEVSVEVLAVNGVPYVLQITDKITSGPPFFFEMGQSQPSALPEEVKQKIAALAAQACISVGIENSPAHVEIKVTMNGPKLVELGARLGGDCISTYLLETSVRGINLVEETIRMALGETCRKLQYCNSGTASAVRFVEGSRGTITSISGIDQAKKSDGVVHVSFTGKVGRPIGRTTDNSSRLGFVVAKGCNTAEALDRCQKAIRKIRITYSD